MSLLGGVKKMKLGFVQRSNENSSENHHIVGTHTVDTDMFANQINLNLKNCWAIVDDVLGAVIDLPEKSGEYIFLKEVSAQNYRLVKKSEAINEEDEEYESEEEEEEE